jgi:hypothetical protein
VLGLPLGEPDIIAGHGPAMALPEVAGGPVDEGLRVGKLPFQGLLMAVISYEDRAGEAPLTELTTMFQQFMAAFRSLPLICPGDRIR